MKRKGSKNSQYRIRQIVTHNKTGDAYGITIPQSIAKNFIDCYFRIEVKGTDIILHSGCHINEVAKNEDFEEYTISKKKVLTVK